MIRAIAAVLALSVTLSCAAALQLRAPQSAGACSWIIKSFDESVTKASFIGIVRVDSTGNAKNQAPPMTPWTPPPRRTPFPTSEPFPTRTPDPDASLQGRGARVSVMETFHGEASPQFDLDAGARARQEKQLRQIEAGQYSSCPVFTAAKYERGGEYLLIMTVEDTGAETVQRYAIEDDAILIDAPLTGSAYADQGLLHISAELYERYLAGYDASRGGVNGKGAANLKPQPVALGDVRAAIDEIRSRIIIPPDTGSGGHADAGS